jgi:hypothetical protein
LGLALDAVADFYLRVVVTPPDFEAKPGQAAEFAFDDIGLAHQRSQDAVLDSLFVDNVIAGKWRNNSFFSIFKWHKNRESRESIQKMMR